MNDIFFLLGPISFGFASLEGSVNVVEQSESMPGSPVSFSSSPPTPPLGSELAAVRTVERAHQTDPITQQSQVNSYTIFLTLSKRMLQGYFLMTQYFPCHYGSGLLTQVFVLKLELFD